MQALLDVEPGVINLVELARSWWPRSWFEDDAMTIPGHLVWECLGRACRINPGQVGLERGRGAVSMGQLQYRQVLPEGAEPCPTNPRVDDKLLACACGALS